MKITHLLILSLITTIILACNPERSTNIAATAETSPTTSLLLTFTPVLITSTQNPTAIPKVTPSLLPTVSLEGTGQLLRELLQTNDHCTGSCFWGIKPGLSNFDDAVIYLKSLGGSGLEGVKDSIRYYNTIYNYKNKDDTIINVVLLEQNGKVDKVGASINGLQNDNVTNSEWSAFRPDKVIEVYGTPSNAQIRFDEGPGGKVSYQLILIYEKEKISFLYDISDSTVLPNSVLRTCPLAEHNIEKVDLWLGKAGKDVSNENKDIGEVSSLTTEDLSDLLTNKNEQACFDLTVKH